MKEKMWALMVYLSENEWSTPFNDQLKKTNELTFDEDFWEYIKKGAQEAGFNTILLDVGDGVQYASHPEISLKGAWSKKKSS